MFCQGFAILPGTLNFPGRGREGHPWVGQGIPLPSLPGREHMICAVQLLEMLAPKGKELIGVAPGVVAHSYIAQPPIYPSRSPALPSPAPALLQIGVAWRRSWERRYRRW